MNLAESHLLGGDFIEVEQSWVIIDAPGALGEVESLCHLGQVLLLQLTGPFLLLALDGLLRCFHLDYLVLYLGLRVVGYYRIPISQRWQARTGHHRRPRGAEGSPRQPY